MLDFDNIVFFASYYQIYLILLISIISVVSIYFIRKNEPSGLIAALIFTGFPYILVRFAGGGIIEYIICIFLPVLFIVALGLYFLDNKKKKKQKVHPPYDVPLIATDSKSRCIGDTNRGVAIFGSSGSGKTAGPITAILKDFARKQFAGVINDFKEYELTEVAYPLFKQAGVNFKVFAPFDVNRSVRLNVVSPHLIDSEAKLNGIVSTLVMNLARHEADSEAGSFFRGGEESLLSAVLWRLKQECPEKCNLPFAIALLLSSESLHEKVKLPNGQTGVIPYQKLINFICQDPRAEILGSTYLTGRSNEKQTGALYATLADNLRGLATPELFYLLSGNDLDLDLNSDQNRTVLSFVNQPGYREKIISPVNAMLMQSAFAEMSKRNRRPSFALLDEAPTIKMSDLPSQIRTLRSYGLAFIYCLQDKVSGVVQYDGKEYMIKDILANLSTQFMGKVNDPDTAKYYEKYFEIVQETRISKSYSQADFLNTRDDAGRITKSTQDKSKRKAHEFFQLQQGQFIMYSEGVDDCFTFHYEEPVKELPPMCRNITKIELEDYFNNILDEARNFFN